MGTAVASTECSTAPAVPYGVAPYVPSETEDANASDAPSEAAPDAADASATTGSSDSSSAADVPTAVPLYGAAVLPDE
jgi:hypothetical protein